MKIKAKCKAYYNGDIVKVGEVIEFKGSKVPSWATLANGKEQKKEETGKVPAELKLTQELDELIKEAAEIDVWVNGTGKTLEEQIAEYKEAIAAKKAEFAAVVQQGEGNEAKDDEEAGEGNNEPTEQELDELITTATELGIILEGAELDLPIHEKIKVLTDKIANAIPSSADAAKAKV
jgi:hypothetical protein